MSFFRIGFLLGFLIIAGTIAYYFIIYIPQRDKAKLDQQIQSQSQEQQTVQDTRYRLGICISNAESAYHNLWDRSCQGHGLASSCNLPSDEAQYVQKILENQKSDCFRLYSQ